jgi:hypothetical protein
MRTFKFICLILLATLMFPAGSALADDPAIIWWAEYFDNPKLEGNPVRAIREAEIDYDWGYESPLVGVPADHFSVRWSTKAHFDAGYYTFTATVDDGVRMWLDGELVIDQWKVQSVRAFTVQKKLAAGEHTIQLAYFDKGGAAVAKLWWRQDIDPPETPDKPKDPDHGHGHGHGHGHKPKGESLLIDNRDPGFTWGGPSRYRQVGWGGYGHDYFWTLNTRTSPSNYAKWEPTFSRGGHYEIFVFVPGNHATTAQLRYRVMHNGERHDRLVDQDWYFDQWISLGVYHFKGRNDGTEFIVAYDNTREPDYATHIAFDAVKLVPVK